MQIFVSNSSKDQPVKSAEHLQFLMALTGVLSIEHLQIHSCSRERRKKKESHCVCGLLMFYFKQKRKAGVLPV